jgi:hypothetical protein
MKSFSALTLVATASAFKHFDIESPCAKFTGFKVGNPGEPLPILEAALPTAFDWSNKDGVNMLTNVWN